MNFFSKQTMGASLLLMLFSSGLCAATPAEQAAVTRNASEHYLALDTAGRYDELLKVYTPDAVFSDPTGDVFQGPIGDGPITGSEAIVALQRSWNLAEQDFAVQGAFAVGDIAVHHGVITVSYQNAEGRYPIPFVTIHKVRDGKVYERLDFGEYIHSLGLGNRFDESTATTQTVAKDYLQAYLSADFDKQTKLSAENIIFQDPTARVFGTDAGQPIVGRDTLIQRRKHTFSKVTDFDLEVEQSFVANPERVKQLCTTLCIIKLHLPFSESGSSLRHSVRTGHRCSQPG